MALYKEIVTKAIVGKGKKNITNSYKITTTSQPTTVLGCWVINHKFKGYKTGNKIGVTGTFDVNIWYSYDNNSKTTVVNEKIEYNDLFNIKLKDNVDLNDDTEIIVRSLKQPSCLEVKILDGEISFKIEKELGIEVVGETMIKIAVSEDEEPWDSLDDVEEELKEIDKINDKYI